MKKQIKPNVKAHLIRSAFYVLLLLAVCVIPFALAQRNTPKRSAATKSKVAATKAQLMAARDRAKSVPSSLIGKRQLAPHRPPGAPKSLGQRRSDVAQAPNLSPWNIVANYPFASESVSVSSDGTFAYAVGGFDSGSAARPMPLTSMIRLLMPGLLCRTFQVPFMMPRRFTTRPPTRFMYLAALTPPSLQATSSRSMTSVPASGLRALPCLVRAISPAQRIMAVMAESTLSVGLMRTLLKLARPGSTTLSRIRGTPRGQTCLRRRVALDTAL